MHADQLDIPTAVVRALVEAQFPVWAHLRVTAVVSDATDNAIFRIGDGLAARFPLQPGDVAATRRRLERAADTSRRLVGRLRVPVTEPVALGEPGPGYPFPWSVQTWLPGTTATVDDPRSSDGFAHDLAGLIRDLRRIDTRGERFGGSGRGGDLRVHDGWMQTCFQRSEALLDVPRLRRLWRELRELPRTAPDLMTHGDLIPGNVLVSGGRLAGVLDTGGAGPADPALDLVGAWHLLDAGPRDRLRDDLGCDDVEWARGRAWAFAQAMGLVWYYAESNPAMSRLGRCTLDRLLADA